MSSLSVHLQQARHNKQLANIIFRFRLPFKDWIVTACFYTGVHLAEALFYVLKPLNNEHSETTKPSRHPGGFHGWRESLIDELVKNSKLDKQFWVKYKDLHIQSDIARYLAQPMRGRLPLPINQLSDDYFSHNDIENFYKKHLTFLEQEARPYLSYISLPFDKRYTLFSILSNIFKR